MTHLVSTATPILDETLVTTIAQELSELEKKPINNWDATYPTLFNFLNETLKELSASASLSPTPGIVVRFDAINTAQALAMIMTDGSRQIHIGAQFIRNFILNDSEQSLSTRYELFKWALAHEIGHLCDPAFILYGKTFQLRTIINQTLSMLLYGGVIGSFFPQVTAYLGFDPRLLSLISMTGSAAFYIATIALHRKFEYNADERSMAILSSITPEQVEQALHMLRAPIIALCENLRPATPRSLVEQLVPGIAKFHLYRKYLLFKYFHLHPSVKHRIKRLKTGK